jgi:hypothetical protein
VIDNEDKKSWCQAGELAEKDFVATNKLVGWGLAVNPNKHDDIYTHDLVGMVPMDLKSIREPWRKSQQLFGIPSDYAISINLKDLRRYAELYPNIIIILDVEWSGIYMMTVARAKTLITNGKAVKHEYKNRKDDTKGNAKVSYVFDLRDLDRLRENK